MRWAVNIYNRETAWTFRKTGLTHWYIRLTKNSTFHPKGEVNIYKQCPRSDIISGVEPTKNQRKEALNDMIDKVEFTAKNLTSNAGVLLLLNYTEEQRIFQELDEIC